MQQFKPVTKQDGAKLRRYYKNCNYGLCEYSLGTKLMWKKALHPAWAEIAGCLVVRNRDAGGWNFDYPVPGPEGDEIAALYLSDLRDLALGRGENPLDTRILLERPGGAVPLPYPELVLFSALDPAPGEVTGRSLLRGLPFLSGVLMEIYRSMGQNFRRVGAVRYAVTCKPGPGTDPQQAAETIAREWQGAMTASGQGEVRDFVAVGDVDIQVIGADAPVLDSQVPVRQILEQLVARTGIPPFMLGLSWSSTERMSAQQADLLTSEITAIRRQVEPALRRIAELWLALRGYDIQVEIQWDDINLQDLVEEARAELYRAQAEKLRRELDT